MVEDVGLGMGEHLLLDNGQEIVVEDLFLLVAELLKSLERLRQILLAEIYPEVLEPFLQCVASRVLAQDKTALRHTHRFRRHDLVGQGVRKHPVLVDSRFVRKGIRSNNRLIRLDRNAGDFGEKL